MNEHVREHEDLLREWIAESPGAAPPSALTECATCRDVMTELLEVQASVAAAGDDLRGTLERAATLERVPGEEAAETFWRERLGGEPRPARRWRRFLLPVTAAAAAVLFTTLRVRVNGSNGEAGTDEPRLLGAEEAPAIELRTPVGETADYRVFDWSGTLPEGWTATVRVRDARSSDPAPIAESPPLSSPPWTPSIASAREWPDRILWELSIVDASGDERAAYSESASRSPR